MTAVVEPERELAKMQRANDVADLVLSKFEWLELRCSGRSAQILALLKAAMARALGPQWPKLKVQR